MPDLPPYVAAKDDIRARASVRGQQYDSIVLGRRGDRIYLTWRIDMGEHLEWVPAADVRRPIGGPAHVLIHIPSRRPVRPGPSRATDQDACGRDVMLVLSDAPAAQRSPPARRARAPTASA
jgi:hypothetical protein